MSTFDSRTKKPAKQSAKLVTVLAILVALSLCGLILIALRFFQDAKKEEERISAVAALPKAQLLLGNNAPIGLPLDIPIDYTPRTLNGLSIEQILATRKSRVATFIGSVLRHEYTPREDLYNLFRSGAKWQSLLSLLFTGRQGLCGTGTSLDTFSIMNPLLPIDVRFWGLSIWNERFKWAENIPAKRPEIFNSDFPAWPYPTRLTYMLVDQKVTIEYQLSSFLQALQPWVQGPLTNDQLIFTLNSFNARELGFETATYNETDSSNVTGIFTTRTLTEQIASTQAPSAKESCNAASYSLDPLMMFAIKELPAKLSLTLNGASVPASTTEAEPVVESDEPREVPAVLNVTIIFN